jgi:hypothetical protein
MKKSSDIAGYSLVGAGVVLVIMGALPLFQGIHWEGVFLGLGSFVAGAWVLAGKDLRSAIRRAWNANREHRVPHSPKSRASGPVQIDPLLPVRILKLAKDHDGVLTVANVAMELNVPLAQAQAGLEECVRVGNATPDYDIPRGHALYRFPEFLPPDSERLSN